MKKSTLIFLLLIFSEIALPQRRFPLSATIDSLTKIATRPHSALQNLTSDDHTQYALLAGRSGGQILTGGTAASENLTLRSTSNATKGNIILGDDGSKVGIGTTGPGYQLHVYRNSTGSNGIIVENALPTNAAHPAEIILKRTGIASTQHAAVGVDYTARDFFIWVNGQDRLNITETGNVGIGTTAPSSLLHLYSANPTQSFSYNNISYLVNQTVTTANIRNIANQWNNSFTSTNTEETSAIKFSYRADANGHIQDAAIRFYTQNNNSGTTQERMSIVAGNVGIQTTNPQETIHANGNIRADGHVIVNNTDGTARELRLYEPSGSGTNYAGFKAQAMASNVIWTLPAADGTNGQVLQTNGAGVLSFATVGGGFDPTTTVELYEEFVLLTNSRFGDFRFSTGGSAGTFSPVAVVGGEVGVARLEVSAGTNVNRNLSQESALNFRSNQGNAVLIIRNRNAAAAAAGANRRIGIADVWNTDSQPTNGIYFEALGTGNWNAVTRSSSIQTITDTGVAQSTTWKTFKIESNADGSSIKFYIDGVLKATHTTNIPNALVMIGAHIIDTNGTGSHAMDFDYFYYKVTGLSR